VADVPEEIIRELYAAPPDRFTAGREQAAADIAAAGDPAVAKAIKALRKPTVAAWTVNLLAIKRPELIDSLIELAAALRSAQRELRGDDLRKLSGERRKVISSLVAQAQSLATEEQPGVKVAVAEVEATLAAAMADEHVGEQVRSGRLVRTTAAAGEFLVDPSATVSRAGSSAAGPSKVDKPARPRAVPAALKKELASAEKAEEKAREELSAAETASQDAAAEVERIEEELEELRRQRSEAEEELSHRRQAHRFAQRALAAATRRVMEAQAAIEDAS
jgi:peptidoglycan hydrolase CwlO-like protein